MGVWVAGFQVRVCSVVAFACFLILLTPLPARAQTEEFQYVFEDITIPKASFAEPFAKQFSVQRSLDYLDQANEAWNSGRKCITCHTNGSYMTIRPALSPKVGPPPLKYREFFESALHELIARPRTAYLRGINSTQVIYVAAGLSEWDAHVTKQLSAQTRRALRLMFEIQREDGSWTRPSTCWPPFESDSYHGATLAAMSIATAPDWLESTDAREFHEQVKRLRHYLRTEPPPHDYGRLWLLRAAARMPDLLPARRKSELVALIMKHQRPNGGWSIRSFGRPEEWGAGNRARKLREEEEFQDPPSDGHQTGLAIVALREAGVPKRDERIQRGVRWLLANQRVSGRWWTRSLNTDRWHYITLSGTGYALQALYLTDSIPDYLAVKDVRAEP